MNQKFLTGLLLTIFILNSGCGQDKPAADQSAAENLIAIVMSDAKPQIRKEALHRLAHGGHEEGAEAVVSATYDTSWVVRRQAIISLKYFSSRKAVMRLREMVQDSIPKIQILAIETLYRSQKEDHLATVLQFLNNEDAEIRSLAAQTFSYIAEKRFLEPLKKALQTETDPGVKTQLEKAIAFVEQLD